MIIRLLNVILLISSFRLTPFNIPLWRLSFNELKYLLFSDNLDAGGGEPYSFSHEENYPVMGNILDGTNDYTNNLLSFDQQQFGNNY